MVAVPTPLIRRSDGSSDGSRKETTEILLLEKENTLPPLVSVFVDDGISLNDELPYALVIGASVISGLTDAEDETTNVADIVNSRCVTVAACVAVMTVEPIPTMITVRPLTPPIVATALLLLENVKPTVVSVAVGSIRSNDASVYFLPGTVKLLNDGDTTREALTLLPLKFPHASCVAVMVVLPTFRIVMVPPLDVTVATVRLLLV